MGKVFKKVVGATIGGALAGSGGALAGYLLAKDKNKKSSSSAKNEAKTKALEEEQAKMRKELFGLQEKQRLYDLQSREETFGNPFSRW